MQSIATLPSESDCTQEGSGVPLKVQKWKTKLKRRKLLTRNSISTSLFFQYKAKYRYSRKVKTGDICCEEAYLTVNARLYSKC